MAAPAEMREFVEALFGEGCAGLHTYVWTLPDKRTTWLPADDPGRIARAAANLVDGHDVYVSVALAAAPGRVDRRITAEQAVGIVGLWADVDIADPDAHKKWNLPRDQQQASEILQATRLKPSLVIHSGHGLQAWWLFREPWIFDGDQNRMEAAALAQAWNTTLRVRAAEREVTIDSTFDLSRVMRLPGTVNRKNPNEPVAVKLIARNAERYSPDDFEPYLVDEAHLRKLGLQPTRSYQVGDLKLAEDAQFPFDKWEALCLAEPAFKKSWDRTRSDFPDQSGSTYDLSLATIAANTGWTDQEIANLIIASRRKHGDDVSKAMRPDYMARTIAKARDGVARERAVHEMEEVTEALREARRSGDDEKIKQSRRATLESISQQLGIEVTRIVKYVADPPSYRMETPTGGIDLGPSSGVLSWHKMRENIAAQTGVVIPRFKTAAYDQLAQSIFEVCEEQDTGMESTVVGQVYVWLTEYLMARRPAEDREQAVMAEAPFIDESGVVYVFGSQLRRWLWLSRGERITQREMGQMLRLFGCKPVRMNVTVAGSKTTRSVWSLPPLDIE